MEQVHLCCTKMHLAAPNDSTEALLVLHLLIPFASVKRHFKYPFLRNLHQLYGEVLRDADCGMVV
jgi:hypothetical protein